MSLPGESDIMTHYEDVLYEARKKGETVANKYIVELYNILRDEEHLRPEDCRAKIEQDCMDLWSKATIRKFLPEEAKNPRKSKAGRIGAERRKKLEQGQKSKSIQVIELNTDGSASTSTTINSQDVARTNPAENDSVSQEEEESRRFHAELSQELGSRALSPALLQARKFIEEKEQRIEELESLLLQQRNSNGRVNPEIYLSHVLAEKIYDTINLNRAARIPEIDFILRHDGSSIIAIQCLSGINSNSSSKKGTMEQKADS